MNKKEFHIDTDGNYKDFLIKDSGLNICKQKVGAYATDFSRCSWKYTLLCMLGYFLWPISFPIMILFSKILKREISFFPVIMEQ